MKSPSSKSSTTGPANAPAFPREDLPLSFQPRPLDVIIGRGKQVNKHNDKNGVLQDLLQSFSGDYLYGKKERKSDILTIVVKEIRATGCAFVKKERIGSTADSSDRSSSASPSSEAFRWYSVDETAARNSAAQFLRNHLSDNYKSSKQFKKKLRMDKKNGRPGQNKVSRVVSENTTTEDNGCDSDRKSIVSLGSCDQRPVAENEMPALPSKRGKPFSDCYEQKHTDSLLTLFPPTSSRSRSGGARYQYNLLTEPFSTGCYDDLQYYPSQCPPYSNHCDIMNMELPKLDDDDDDDTTNNPLPLMEDLEPRPIGPGISSQHPTNNGMSVFHSTEDEELFLSWTGSGL